MKPLNYFRKIIRDCRRYQGIQPTEEREEFIKVAINQARKCVKFMLPPTGRILEDLQFKCLDETQPLRLPFPICGFEYERPTGGELLPGEVRCPKAAFVASESELGEDSIFVLMFCYNSMVGWTPTGFVSIPKTNYLYRNYPLDCPNLNQSYNKKHGVPFAVTSWHISGLPELPPSDFSDEVGALLCFLNALQCSNVEVTKLPRQTSNLTHREALKVDQYHVLSMKLPKGQSSKTGPSNEMHRSPREHLRRGHIRILQSGEKIWINSTVVNAGKGYGKITKDYHVK